MPRDFFVNLSDNKTPPTHHFFDGERWTVSTSGQTIDILSPIDDKIIGKIQAVSHAQADQAILRAKKAQREWQLVPMTKRGHILHLVSDWIRHHEPFLTTLLIKEIAKPYNEAKDEILASADMIDYFAHEGLHIQGEELSGDSFPGYDNSKIALVERVALGLILAIPPFNYPVNLAVSKIAPALMTGNAVVYKPATQGSIISLYLTEIFHLADLPKGLIVTLTGSGVDIGDYFCTHQSINLITFTGSSSVGKSIAGKAGMIPLLFECGGNNGAIVLPDADMESTAAEIVKGAFSYAGQRCTAIKYVLGLGPTIDALLPKIIEKTKLTMKIGDPRIPENTLGPVISDSAADEVEKRILEAKGMGAHIVLGGNRSKRYIEPTILTDVRPSMEIMHTETFGPVLSFVKVSSMDEAVSIINDSNYGLQASIFTQDEGAAIALGKKLDVGTVQINGKPQRGPDHFPFLGVKGSGTGVQGIRYSLEAMTRPRPIILNKPQ